MMSAACAPCIRREGSRGRKPLSEIKLMKDDADGGEKQAETLKQRYAKVFGT